MFKNRKTCVFLSLTIFSLILVIGVIIAITLATQSQGKNRGLRVSQSMIYGVIYVGYFKGVISYPIMKSQLPTYYFSIYVLTYECI